MDVAELLGHDVDRQARRGAAFESELHGETGYQQLLSTPRGSRRARWASARPTSRAASPVAGSDLYLSLDAGLQRVAEEALAGQRAAVVAIDRATATSWPS